MQQAVPSEFAVHAPMPQHLFAAPRPIATMLPLLLIFYSFLLLPPETEFTVFGVRLFGYRLMVLLMTPPALWMMIRYSKGGINMVDIAIGFMAFWMNLSFAVVYGLEEGFVRGLGTVLDGSLCYFVARACISSPDEMRRFLVLVLPGFLFAGGMMLLESVSGRLLYRPFAASLFGHMTRFAEGQASGSLILESDYRLGMVRAMGPFDHPILAGSVLVGCLPLYYFSGLRGWPYILGVAVALTGLLSLSSAAILGLVLAATVIAIYHVKPYIPKLSWWIVVGAFATLVMVAHLASKNGIIPVITRLTLSPETGSYRLLIWKYGINNVINHPLFGLGYQAWDRVSWMSNETVDAHFLLLAMRHGIAVPLVLLAGIFFGMARLGSLIGRLPAREQPAMLGVNITVFLFVLVGQTVTFFGASQLAFMSFLGFLGGMVSWAGRTAQADREWQMMQRRQQMYHAQAIMMGRSA